MTEGTAVRTKRMGARFFKNPPQPHMCIRDSLKGSPDPCYINVLSWDKVAAGMSTEGIPLYGGMKVCPPRTEKKDVMVFAVMANPEILKLHGKNTKNPKERLWLIERLLDFVEKMNEGIIFNRLYTVLRDRDITGELKEIWMIVQSERVKAQQIAGVEELRRPVPQYAQYQEQQQQQMQQHQHPPQQQQSIQHPHEEHVQLPPQYQPNVYYAPEQHEKCESYELSYGRQTQNIMISMKDRVYQNPPVAPQYHGNDSRVDHYIFRDPNVAPNPQGPQQHCLGYPAYQYPPLPRQMGPPFPPNIHPNAVLNCPPHPPNLIRPEPPIHYNKFYERIHRMPLPPQRPQSPQPPIRFHHRESFRPDSENSRENRRSNYANEPKTVVTVESGETLVVPPPLEQSKLETSAAQISTLQQPNYAVMMPIASSIPLDLSLNDSTTRDHTKEASTVNGMEFFPEDPRQRGSDNSVEENVVKNTGDSKFRKQQITARMRNCVEQYRANENSKKPGKPKIKVLKRNKSVDDQNGPRESMITINGDVEHHQDSLLKDRMSGKQADVEDRLNKIIPDAARNGNAEKPRDQTRLSKTTTSLKNTLKILAGGGSNDEVSSKNKKINGQVKLQNGKDSSDDVFHVYKILKKPEATTSREDITNDISQLTIKDSGETGEVGTVVS